MNRGITRIQTLVPRKARDYGGKARGLATLARAGFPVMPAFAVPGSVGEDVLATVLSPEDRLETLVAQPFLEIARTESIAARIQKASLPPDLEAILEDCFRVLLAEGADAVAVRSSSTIEDQEDASAAGLHASILHVTSVPALFDAARACWASLYSERVIAHLRMSAPGPALRMGIVIQAMVPADVAGVVFTMNPLTGDESELVVNAAYGLGAGVVDGRITPDTVRVDKQTLTPRDTVIGEKAFRISVDPGGGTREIPVDEADRARLCLSEKQLETVCALALGLERHFEKPQDVEFALRGDEAFVLQARPITAIVHRRARRRGPPKDRSALVWSNVNVGEALPGVATPLTWSVLSAFSELGFLRAFGAIGCRVPRDSELVGAFRGRIYLNMSEFLAILSQVPGIDARTLLSLGGSDFAQYLTEPLEPRSSAAFLSRLPVTVGRFVRQNVRIEHDMELYRASFAVERRRLRAIDLRLLSPLALDRTLNDVDRLLDQVGSVMLRVYGSLLAQVLLLLGALRLLTGAEFQALTRGLLTGLSDLDSAAPGIALARLAETLRFDGPARAIIASRDPNTLTLADLPDGPTKIGLSRFVEEFGHRGTREAEIAEPRWREDPSVLFRALSILVIDDTGGKSLRERDLRVGGARLRAEEALSEQVPLPLRPVLRALVRRVQHLVRMRETLRSDVTEVLGLFRGVALEVSNRIEVQEPDAGEGAAFFLTLDELRGVMQGRISHVALRVQQRRVQYQRDAALPDPPGSFVGYPPTELESVDQAKILTGLAASAGIAEGAVRILHSPNEASSFRPGEVLVVPCADVGWSPLFLAASAVVTDLGGPLSHAAIVLREYGVPAVVNVKNATRVLVNGERVRVEADAARVVRLGA